MISGHVILSLGCGRTSTTWCSMMSGMDPAVCGWRLAIIDKRRGRHTSLGMLTPIGI